MANNPILLNAAISGLSGGCQQRWITSDNVADYVELKNGVAVFAAAIDAVIPSLENVTLGEALLMQSICHGVASGRLLLSTNVNDYVVTGKAIAACFAAVQ